MPSADTARTAITQLVSEGGDADDVLRNVVRTLVAEGGYDWSGIFFVENGELVLGPDAGTADPPTRTRIPVTWHGTPIAELAVDGAPEADHAFLADVAALVAELCLVGWDTGGEAWLP